MAHPGKTSSRRQLEDVGAGSSGLRVKSLLSEELFTISRNKPAMEGTVSSGLSRPEMSEHHKIWKIKYTINASGTATLVGGVGLVLRKAR